MTTKLTYDTIPNDVQYVFVKSDFNRYGKRLPHAEPFGVFAFRLNGDVVTLGTSFCSDMDQFNKKDGVLKAVGRTYSKNAIDFCEVINIDNLTDANVWNSYSNVLFDLLPSSKHTQTQLSGVDIKDLGKRVSSALKILSERNFDQGRKGDQIEHNNKNNSKTISREQ